MIQTTTFADPDQAISIEKSRDAFTTVPEFTLSVNDVQHVVTVEQLLCLRDLLNEIHNQGYLDLKTRLSTTP